MKHRIAHRKLGRTREHRLATLRNLALSLFEHERIARIRWSANGDRAIQWMGVRTALPIAGIDTGRPDSPDALVSITDSTASLSAGEELERDMAEDLLDAVQWILTEPTRDHGNE